MASPYAQTPNSGGSVYSTRRGGGGSVYASRGGDGTTPAKKKKKGGGGIGHVLGQTLSDFESIARHAPAGFVELGGAIFNDYRHHRLLSTSGETAKIAKAQAKSVVEDIKHPLRHPGYTALDLLAVGSLGAGTAARGAAVGRAARAGAGAGKIAKEALRPTVGTRTLRAGKVSAEVRSSRSALTRFTQRHIDSLRERFPDAHIGIHDQYTRVGRALERQRATEYKLHTTPFTALRAAGRKIKHNSPEGLALRAVAEGTPVETMIRTWKADLAKAEKPSVQRSLRRQIAVAEKAKKFTRNIHLEDGTLVPRLGDQHLAELFEKTKAAALLEDERLATAGLASKEGLEQAIQNPGRIYRGAEFDEKAGLVGAEEFKGGQFHVGQERRPKAFSVNKQPQAGNAGSIGIPRRPGRLTHPLTGGTIHEGALRHDVPRLVAENALESERHAALLRARDFFIENAQDTPEGLRKPIPIRLDELKSAPFPNEVKAIQDIYRQGRHLNRPETSVLGLTYDTFRNELFPDINPADVGPHPGVKWIDERLLGGLNKPSPLATLQQYKGGRLLLGFADAVNNASRAAILYLKPAYAVPNMVGNAFLVLTQQGWAAPKNLARSARLARRVGPENAAIIDNLMGEGFATSISAEKGISAGAINWMARQWSKGVDVPFRRASFLYEANRAGFKTKKQIEGLVRDEAHAKQAALVTERANRALIDYSDLTPIERDIVRRVVFFYPWLKGSTKYAAEYLREHPLQAAIIGQEGKRGKELQQEGLGDVPAYAADLLRVGGTDELPRVINPSSAGVLSQPAQLSAIARGFLGGGHVPRGNEISGLLTPFVGAAGAAALGYDAFKGEQEPNIATFVKQLTEGIPPTTLYDRLRKDQSGRLYPVSKRDAILQYLLGGLAPRPVNRAKLNQYAREDQNPRR